VVVLCLRCKDY